MPGSTAQTNKYHTFYLQQRQDNGDTWADIKVNHPLDYETIKEYNLTIRVEVSFFISYFDAYKSTMMQFTHRTRETWWKYPSESFADGLRLIVLTFHRINTLKLARLLRSSAQLAFKLNLKRDYNETESHYHAVRIGGKRFVRWLCTFSVFVEDSSSTIAMACSLLLPHHFPSFHPQFNYLNSIFNAENNLSSFFSEF